MIVKSKYWVFLILLGLSGTLLLYRYFIKSWTPYYKEKLYKAPRPLLVKAVELFEKNGDKHQDKLALDLGAGAGNSTAFLLQHGWHVWANDKEEEAIKLISERKDVAPYKDNLRVVHTSFVNLPWASFPQFDLVYAGYSLPFAQSKNFGPLWKHIVDTLKRGGLFAGHFFGTDHAGFNWWQKRKMIFFSKDEVMELLSDFEILFFEEFHEKNERGILDYSFSVVARKL